MNCTQKEWEEFCDIQRKREISQIIGFFLLGIIFGMALILTLAAIMI